MNRIKQLRQQRGLSIDELSKQLKEKGISISPASISKYERGARKPKIDKWIQLADFFDVPVSYLQGTSVISDKKAFESYPKLINAMKDYGLTATYEGVAVPLPNNPQTSKEMTNLIIEKEYRAFSLACKAFASENNTDITRKEAVHYQNIANELKTSAEMDEVNFYTGYLFRMILDAKNGNKKAQKYYKKLQIIINDYLGIDDSENY